MQQRSDGTIHLSCTRGHPAPGTLKTLTCRQTGWFGEAAISYAGIIAVARARMARRIIEAQCTGLAGDVWIECHDGLLDGVPHSRLRVAVRSVDKAAAGEVLDRLEALYTNGPAGGGGRRMLSPLVETEVGAIPAGEVSHTLHWEESAHG